MKNIKGLGCMLLLALLIVFSGCGRDDKPKGDIKEAETPKGTGLQFEEPGKDTPVATIVVEGFGEMKFRLFPEQAPKAVQNFIELSEKGYYDGVTFYRVISDFMIQGGDPTGTGSGGESYFGEDFEDEFSMELFPYRGSLCMANAGADTNGSQFFIVQKAAIDDNYTKQLQEIRENEIADNYSKIGGTPWLWYAHTVFGQIIDGMEVVDAIAAVETNASDKPAEDVVIKTVSISYGK